MPLFGVSNGVMWSIINRIAGGFKSVGFRSAYIGKIILWNSDCRIALGIDTELSAQPNLQELDR